MPKPGCCSSNVDPDAPFAPKINEGRRCTDCIFLILFIVFWIGMLVVAFLAFNHGNPNALIYGNDHTGKNCGSNTVANNVYYPRITQDMIAAAQGGMTDPTKMSFYGVCLKGCPQKGNFVCNARGLDKLVATQDLTPEEAAMNNINKKMKKAHHTLRKCMKGVNPMMGKFASAIARRNGPHCVFYADNCWSVLSATEAVFHRCLPQRNVTSKTTANCDQAGSEANSPDCQTVTTHTEITTQQPAQEDPVQKQMQGVAMRLSRYFGDLFKAKAVVLGVGAGLALVLGFVWIMLLRFFAPCMVWATIILVMIVLLFFTLFCYSKAGLLTRANAGAIASNSATRAAAAQMTAEVNAMKAQMAASGASVNAGGANQKNFEYVAYAMTAISVLNFLMVIFLRKRIAIAIGILKEASKALAAMPTMVLFPFITFTSVLALMVYWIVVAAYLQSSTGITMGSIKGTLGNTTLGAQALSAIASAQAAVAAQNWTAPTVNVSVNFANNETQALYEMASLANMDVLRWMQLYHFFGLLWTNQFIQAVGVMTIAGAVCSWYWVMDKSDTPRFALLQSYKRTLLYHLGSIAFGSLIVAVIQLMRAILAYLDRKSKSLQQANIAIKIAFKAVACCLWCFEKCVKFINKNAFIICAMMGWSFCKSTKEAVRLLMANAAQVGAMTMVATLMMMMGKLFIAGLCGIIAFFLFDKAPMFQPGASPGPLDSTMFPVIVTTLVSYFVATAFLEVYEMTIDTILICFCLDRENNNGSDKPYYMGDSLRKFIASGGGKKKNKK